MNASNTHIVVSRWNRPTAWTQAFTERGYPVLLYEHGTNVNNPYNLSGNFGKEASVYLKYIMDYYNSLPTYVVFIHDEQFSWHHQGDISKTVLSNEGKQRHYLNFNKVKLGSIHNVGGWWKDMDQWFTRYLEPYIGPHKKYGDWTVDKPCCAQFVVHRDRIRQLPFEFYENLYGWISTTPWSGEQTGRFLEWTWDLLFARRHNVAENLKRHRERSAREHEKEKKEWKRTAKASMKASYDLVDKKK